MVFCSVVQCILVSITAVVKSETNYITAVVKSETNLFAVLAKNRLQVLRQQCVNVYILVAH